MKPIHALAAALIAIGGLSLASPAAADPPHGLSVTAEAGAIVQVGHRDGDRKWRRGDRDDDRRWQRGGRGDDDWRRHGHRTWDDWSRNRHGDWRGDRGRHLGWDRGRGHDRHWRDHRRDKKDKFSAKKHKRWHAQKHPRHRYWHGRHFPRVKYVVIRDYDRYYLPPPRRGHFYARVDNDVFLVAEGTKRIIDAFVLFDAVGR